MTKTQVEVITSVQRRRRWSRAEKEGIVAAALGPGVVASEVAREAGIHMSQLAFLAWTCQVQSRAPPSTVSPSLNSTSLSWVGLILQRRSVVRISSVRGAPAADRL